MKKLYLLPLLLVAALSLTGCGSSGKEAKCTEIIDLVLQQVQASGEQADAMREEGMKECMASSDAEIDEAYKMIEMMK